MPQWMYMKNKKTTKKKPKKRTPRQIAIHNTDRVFSMYIRLRDSDENGWAQCITCGKRLKWTQGKQSHCGHYHGRQCNSLRYNEYNCNFQCFNCNSLNEGLKVEYKAALIKKYGKEIINKLLLIKNQHKKFSVFEFELMIKHYYNLGKELAEKKGELYNFNALMENIAIKKIIK